MSLSFELSENEDYIHCVVSGLHDEIESFLKPFSAIFALCRDSELRRVVFDYRSIEIYPEAADRINFIEMLSQRYDDYLNFGGQAIKFAFIVNKDAFDHMNTPEDVAGFVGLNLARKTNLEDALEWLRADP